MAEIADIDVLPFIHTTRQHIIYELWTLPGKPQNLPAIPDMIISGPQLYTMNLRLILRHLKHLHKICTREQAIEACNKVLQHRRVVKSFHDLDDNIARLFVDMDVPVGVKRLSADGRSIQDFADILKKVSAMDGSGSAISTGLVVPTSSSLENENKGVLIANGRGTVSFTGEGCANNEESTCSAHRFTFEHEVLHSHESAVSLTDNGCHHDKRTASPPSCNPPHETTTLPEDPVDSLAPVEQPHLIGHPLFLPASPVVQEHNDVVQPSKVAGKGPNTLERSVGTDLEQSILMEDETEDIIEHGCKGSPSASNECLPLNEKLLIDVNVTSRVLNEDSATQPNVTILGGSEVLTGHDNDTEPMGAQRMMECPEHRAQPVSVDFKEHGETPHIDEQVKEDSTLPAEDSPLAQKWLEVETPQLTDTRIEAPPNDADLLTGELNSHASLKFASATDRDTESGTIRVNTEVAVSHASSSTDTAFASVATIAETHRPPPWSLTPILAGVTTAAVVVSVICPTLSAVMLYSGIVYAKRNLRK